MKRKPALAQINATVLVLSPGGEQALLVKTHKRKNKSWELPGGKIDQGESLLAGACREVFEETGVRIQLQAMTGLYKCADQDGLMFLFLGQWKEGKLRVKSKEIDSVAWHPVEDLREQIQCDLNGQRLEDCLSYQGSARYRLIRKRPFEVLESWDLGSPLPEPFSPPSNQTIAPNQPGFFSRLLRRNRF